MTIPASVPDMSDLSNIANDLRRAGNVFFINKKYKEAIEKYTEALAIAPNDALVLSNRAAAYLALNNSSKALEDSTEAIKHDSTNIKSYFRKGKALLALKRYTEAKEILKAAKKLDEKSKEVSELLNLAVQFENEKEGVYDFSSIWQEAHKTLSPRLNHLEYIGPVEIKAIPGKDLGLVATKFIPKNTLILVSKAFEMIFPHEVSDEFFEFSIKVCDRELDAPQVALFSRIAEKFGSYSVEQKRNLYNLYAGSDFESNTTIRRNSSLHDLMNTLSIQDESDDELDVEYPRISRILYFNSFSAYTDPLYKELHQNQEMSDEIEQIEPCGLWILPSYINHSCRENANRFFIGDFMFIRSIQDIQEGEEITMTYIDSTKDYDVRQDTISQFGFKCECEVCEADKKIPTKVRIERQKQMETVWDLRHKIHATRQASTGQLKKLETLMKQIQSTKINDTVYRPIDLAEIYKTFAFAYGYKFASPAENYFAKIESLTEEDVYPYGNDIIIRAKRDVAAVAMGYFYVKRNKKKQKYWYNVASQSHDEMFGGGEKFFELKFPMLKFEA
ncbi:hypothetical protein BKA69DRAFT_1126471 [Paraphysoderma sedebokerense]|nr:hypothetical protein BKA69DRAFT_1126471 [Paraphysoderma sedebokerense]